MNQQGPELVGTREAREAAGQFAIDLLRGLHGMPKTIPSKYLYDAAGSLLFERICDLKEYYPTRTECAILRRHADEIAAFAGPACRLVEPGSGSCLKTRIVLDELQDPVAYVPIEISGSALDAAVNALRRDYPLIEILPVYADYSRLNELPEPAAPWGRTVFFFPGSTIGNFEPDEAVAFLGRLARLSAPGDGILVGVDLEKDVAVLEAAYNDSEGITAAFNLNVLGRVNRELGTDFDVSAFDHEATYDPGHHRIEMHLVSRRHQRVRVKGASIDIARDERLVTEFSYKYSPRRFTTLAARAGLRPAASWTDLDRLFGVFYLVPDDGPGLSARMETVGANGRGSAQRLRRSDAA